MSEFVFLYRNGERMASPEQAQQQMNRWLAWLKDLQQKGAVKDPGHPLERSGKVVSRRDQTFTDGPFAETKDVVGGYTLVEAKDLEHAVELSHGCPIFEFGGKVEIRPVMAMSM